MQADYQDSCKQLEDADKLLDFVEVLQILLTTLHDLCLCVHMCGEPSTASQVARIFRAACLTVVHHGM